MSWISGSGGGYAIAPPGPRPSVPGGVDISYRLPINVLDPKYGAKGDGVTDDTGAVQSAMNTAGLLSPTNGITDVWLPPGYAFRLGQMTPVTGVRLWAYGATIKPIVSAVSNVGWFGIPGVSVLLLKRFEIRGGLWTGGFGETFQIFQLPNFSSCTDLEFRDMYVTNWGEGGLYMSAPVRCRALYNTFISSRGSTQPINFVFGNTDPQQMQYIMAKGNWSLDTLAAGIAIGMDTAVAPAGSWPINAVIEGNVITGNSGGNDINGAIDIENSFKVVAGPWRRILVKGNHVTNLRAVGAAEAMTSEISYADVILDGNTISSTNIGVYIETGNSTQVVNNQINAPIPIGGPGKPIYQAGNRFSAGGAMMGQATLVAGTVTVNTIEVQAGDNIVLSRIVAGGTLGQLSVGTIVAGTSFVINSSAADTSTVFWQIIH